MHVDNVLNVTKKYVEKHFVSQCVNSFPVSVVPKHVPGLSRTFVVASSHESPNTVTTVSWILTSDTGFQGSCLGPQKNILLTFQKSVVRLYREPLKTGYFALLGPFIPTRYPCIKHINIG